MRITINGQLTETAEDITLQELLAGRAIKGSGVITELNGQIVQFESRPATKLSPNDTLEIIRIIGGG